LRQAEKVAIISSMNRTPLQKVLIVFNLLLVFLIIAVGVDLLVLQNERSRRAASTTAQKAIEQIQIAQNTPAPTPIVPVEERVPVTTPLRIEIPSIELNAEVVKVGITADNAMDVPSDAKKVGWYELGVKPGDIGGAIMTAHYDTATGKEAVFYNLRNVKQGDIIYVGMEGDEELLFQVTDILSEPVKNFPTELIFGNFTDKKLILITCDGVWNPIEKNYSKRLVVYATLWENKTL
jgi:LPXTG-site transpeptidase (sortase) family protein